MMWLFYCLFVDDEIGWSHIFLFIDISFILTGPGKESKHVFQMARKKFEECLDIKENDHVALYCLAFSFTQLALLSKPPKRDEYGRCDDWISM
jgi:hypothetical protein